MENHLISRLFHVPDYSFFLFGPRGVGKTTYLRPVKEFLEQLPHGQVF